MNPAIFFLIVKAVEKFYDPAVHTAYKDVNDAIKVFVDEANANELTRKEDGSEWTEADVQAALSDLKRVNQQIRDEAQGGN